MRTSQRAAEKYFYPRPPRGGRLGGLRLIPAPGEISIHALREEGDSCSARVIGWSIYFYPRPPRGGRPHLFSSPG